MRRLGTRVVACSTGSNVDALAVAWSLRGCGGVAASALGVLVRGGGGDGGSVVPR